jgi:hypothetical protein
VVQEAFLRLARHEYAWDGEAAVVDGKRSVFIVLPVELPLSSTYRRRPTYRWVTPASIANQVTAWSLGNVTLR